MLVSFVILYTISKENRCEHLWIVIIFFTSVSWTKGIMPLSLAGWLSTVGLEMVEESILHAGKITILGSGLIWTFRYCFNNSQCILIGKVVLAFILVWSFPVNEIWIVSPKILIDIGILRHITLEFVKTSAHPLISILFGCTIICCPGWSWKFWIACVWTFVTAVGRSIGIPYHVHTEICIASIINQMPVSASNIS